uniref:Protein-serine/threonine phosphatase n=1 Tax=Parastrongyloides trichosuri TaxID=131310 RepID=A0A0N4ZT84_PARTI
MSKLKSTKPICYRWYKIIAAIALCIICIIIWIFILNPLLSWDKNFTSNFIKKLTGNINSKTKDEKIIVGKINEFIGENKEEKALENTIEEKLYYSSTIKPKTNDDNFIKNFPTSTTKESTKKMIETSTKYIHPLTSTTYLKKILFIPSTVPPTVNYIKNGVSSTKIFTTITPRTFKTTKYNTKSNIYHKSTHSKNQILEQFNKNFNGQEKNIDHLGYKSQYKEKSDMNNFKNNELYHHSTIKPYYKLNSTPKLSKYFENINMTKNKLINDERTKNYEVKSVTKTYKIENLYPKINLPTIEKNIYPYQQSFYLTTSTLQPLLDINDRKISTTTTTTSTTTEKLVYTRTTEMPIITSTTVITSSIRSQEFAKENKTSENRLTGTLDNKETTKSLDIDVHNKKKKAPVIVTALLDIGRGEWHSFYRPFETYLNSFLDLLKMENNMIIYGDKTVINFVKNHYKNDIKGKVLLEITLKDLPFYRYKNEMQNIIDKEQQNWDPSWDRRMKNHPESMYADYNILVNSKPYFLHNASLISPFESDIFIWIDAGYSHGDHNLIPEYTWDPFFIPNKVHIIKLTPKQDQINTYTYDRVYRKDISVISAGFIGTSRSIINRFYNFFYKTFLELLDDGKVDDDQTVILMTIKNYASLFYVIHGGWFDAFRLLPNLDNSIDKEELKLRYNHRLYQSTYPYWKIHNNSTREKSFI